MWQVEAFSSAVLHMVDGRPAAIRPSLRFNPASVAAAGSFFAFIIAGSFGGGVPLLALAIVLGVVAFGDSLARGNVPFGRTAWLVIISIFAAYPLVLINNDFTSGYFHGGMVLASFGVASVFFRAKLRWLVALVTLALLFYYVVFVGFGGSPSNVFIGSENRVSTLFLALAVFMFSQGERRYDVAFAAAVFLVSLSAEGSAGIIASAFLFSAVFIRDLRRFFQIRIAARLTLAAIGLTAIAGVVYVGPRLFHDDVREALSPTRLTRTDIRFEIIDWYVEEHLSGISLFIGTPTADRIPILTSDGWIWMTNLHNSYLDLHRKTGIISVVILAAFGFRLLLLARRNPFMAALFMVLVIRAFSDTAFILQGTGNFAWYAFLLPIEQLLPGPRFNIDMVRGFPIRTQTEVALRGTAQAIPLTKADPRRPGPSLVRDQDRI